MTTTTLTQFTTDNLLATSASFNKAFKTSQQQMRDWFTDLTDDEAEKVVADFYGRISDEDLHSAYHSQIRSLLSGYSRSYYLDLSRNTLSDMASEQAVYGLIRTGGSYQVHIAQPHPFTPTFAFENHCKLSDDAATQRWKVIAEKVITERINTDCIIDVTVNYTASPAKPISDEVLAELSKAVRASISENLDSRAHDSIQEIAQAKIDNCDFYEKAKNEYYGYSELRDEDKKDAISDSRDEIIAELAKVAGVDASKAEDLFDFYENEITDAISEEID